MFADEVERIGGVDIIENLQTHSNHKIYENALEILEGYFTEENNDDLKLESTLGSGQDMEFKF